MTRRSRIPNWTTPLQYSRKCERKQTACLLKHLEKQMEQYEEAGDYYIAKFGANAKKEMDDIREKQQQSTEAY